MGFAPRTIVICTLAVWLVAGGWLTAQNATPPKVPVDYRNADALIREMVSGETAYELRKQVGEDARSGSEAAVEALYLAQKFMHEFDDGTGGVNTNNRRSYMLRDIGSYKFSPRRKQILLEEIYNPTSIPTAVAAAENIRHQKITPEEARMLLERAMEIDADILARSPSWLRLPPYDVPPPTLGVWTHGIHFGEIQSDEVRQAIWDHIASDPRFISMKSWLPETQHFFHTESVRWNLFADINGFPDERTIPIFKALFLFAVSVVESFDRDKPPSFKAHFEAQIETMPRKKHVVVVAFREMMASLSEERALELMRAFAMPSWNEFEGFLISTRDAMRAQVLAVRDAETQRKYDEAYERWRESHWSRQIFTLESAAEPLLYACAPILGTEVYDVAIKIATEREKNQGTGLPPIKNLNAILEDCRDWRFISRMIEFARERIQQIKAASSDEIATLTQQAIDAIQRATVFAARGREVEDWVWHRAEIRPLVLLMVETARDPSLPIALRDATLERIRAHAENLKSKGLDEGYAEFAETTTALAEESQDWPRTAAERQRRNEIRESGLAEIRTKYQ